jgi:hypothetical protein
LYNPEISDKVNQKENKKIDLENDISVLEITDILDPKYNESIEYWR